MSSAETDFSVECEMDVAGALMRPESPVGRVVEHDDALLLMAENFNILRNGVPDADNRHLWKLASYCLTAKDTAHEVAQDLITTGDYPLEFLDGELSDADDDLRAAMRYSSLRSILPEADLAYLWKNAIDNINMSDAHFGAFVLNLQASGDYPLASANALPPECRIEMKRQALVRNTQNILSNVDSTFIEKQLSSKPELCYEEGGVSTVLINWMNGEYCPSKAEEYYRRQTADAIEQFSKNFDVDRFLKRFPDPNQYFEKGVGHIGPKYLADCMKYLRTIMPSSFNTVTTAELIKKKGLLRCHWSICGYDVPQATIQYRLTNECARFINELTFIRYHSKIMSMHRIKCTTVNNMSTLESCEDECDVKCELCEDWVPSSKVLNCTDAHIFCHICVRNWARTRINEGVLDVNCLQVCSGTLTDRVLSCVLTPSEMTILYRRRQDRDVAAAKLDGTQNCLWCGYLYVPRAGDKNLVCLNPECGETWCRDCKQLPHYPKPCEDTREEIKKRTYIEEKMTAAVVKKCPRCKAEIIRSDGCDHVVCKCNFAICYKCGQASHGHHCNLRVTTQSARSAGLQAKEEADRLYPNVNLTHDPTQLE